MGSSPLGSVNVEFLRILGWAGHPCGTPQFTDSLLGRGHTHPSNGKVQGMKNTTRLLLFAATAILAVAPSIASASGVEERPPRFGSSRDLLRRCAGRGRLVPPPASGVRVGFVRHAVVHYTRTNAIGRYSIRLAPGRYTVLVAGSRFGSDPSSAAVSRGHMSVFNISIDTGIR